MQTSGSWPLTMCGLFLSIICASALLYTYWVPIIHSYPTLIVQGQCRSEDPLTLNAALPREPFFLQTEVPVYFRLSHLNACQSLTIGSYDRITVEIGHGTKTEMERVEPEKRGNMHVYSFAPRHLGANQYVAITRFIAAKRMSADTYTALFATEPQGVPLRFLARSTGAYEVRSGEEALHQFDLNIARVRYGSFT